MNYQIQEAVRSLVTAHDILTFRVDGTKLATNSPDSLGLSHIRNAIKELDPASLKKLEGYNYENRIGRHHVIND